VKAAIGSWRFDQGRIYRLNFNTCEEAQLHNKPLPIYTWLGSSPKATSFVNIHIWQLKYNIKPKYLHVLFHQDATSPFKGQGSALDYVTGSAH